MRKFLIFLMLTACIFNASAQQNPFPKTITVSGSAEMEIVPDEIFVAVELKEYYKTGIGKVGLERIKSEFFGLCKKAGLPDSVISIAAYEGGNLYWWRKKKRKDDLLASISYQLKFTDSKTMDNLVALLDDEATENFQVTGTSHTKLTEFRRQLKIKAIKAAKEKAGYLAEAIDEKAGEAITINEQENFYNNYYSNYFNARSNIMSNSNASFSGSDGDKGAVDFKKMKLRFEVSVVFALK
jgi:hypothetical protein